MPPSSSPDPNPGITAPTTDGDSGTGTRYYDADGNLVGTVDGTGTTATIGDTTGTISSTGAVTGTRDYTFLGQTVAQRTTTGTGTTMVLILSDAAGTGEQMILPTGSTTAGAQVLTRFNDPMGLPRGPTDTTTGGVSFTAATGAQAALFPTSNAANSTGFGASNGYLGALNDAGSGLTHEGARDLDPVTGAFTAPDPVLNPGDPSDYSPYTYSEGDPVNGSDPSGLGEDCDMCDGGQGAGLGPMGTAEEYYGGGGGSSEGYQSISDDGEGEDASGSSYTDAEDNTMDYDREHARRAGGEESAAGDASPVEGSVASDGYVSGAGSYDTPYDGGYEPTYSSGYAEAGTEEGGGTAEQIGAGAAEAQDQESAAQAAAQRAAAIEAQDKAAITESQAATTEQTNTNAANNAAEDANSESAASKAAAFQGQGAYPGVDAWEDTVLTEGTIVHAGEPGLTGFATSDAVASQVGDDAVALNEGLQVASRAGTYRPGLTSFRLTRDAPAARGFALANPQFGPGGFEQYYIPDFVNVTESLLSRLMYGGVE